MNYEFTIEKIILACHVPAGTGSSVHKNRPGHGLAIFWGGSRIYAFDDGTRLRVSGNDIVYLPKGSSYAVQIKENSDCYAINFDIDENLDFAPFVMEISSAEYCLERFKNSQKRWLKRDVGYLMKVKSDLYDIIYQMQREYSNSHIRGTYGRVKPAIDYIHSNYYKEAISIAHLADICGMSEVYLRSLFAKHMNLSPNKYIKNLRLKRAQELLASGFYHASEVCFLSGFSDESYFSREFKKHLGVTPGEYAKASRM
ncbi:MAG: helix-turn-helix transcriptional regulator [Clostridia bacterium]|nr:helix-turn-helix transcriptional regulator [Clostridia bacterium]